MRHPDQPGRFALGIECDGAMYHSCARRPRPRPPARSRCSTGLGWTLHRIWGPELVPRPAGEERRLAEAIERALLEAPSAAPPSAPPRGPIEVDFEDIELDAPPPWVEPYLATIIAPAHAVDVAQFAAAREVRELILRTVTDEGPIVEDLLARRVISAWGDVLSEKRRGIIRRVVEDLMHVGALVRRENAYCLPGQRIDVVRVPCPDDERTQREVKHVPDVELGEAIARLVADARIVSEDEVKQRAARLFGWARVGPGIQAALTRVVEDLAASGRVVRAGGELHAPSSVSSDDLD